MVNVMWRFEGYITTTQSGFSMNRWLHGEGTVEVFRAITTRERAVKKEKNVLAKRTRKHTHLPTVDEYVFLLLYRFFFSPAVV